MIACAFHRWPPTPTQREHNNRRGRIRSSKLVYLDETHGVAQVACGLLEVTLCIIILVVFAFLEPPVARRHAAGTKGRARCTYTWRAYLSGQDPRATCLMNLLGGSRHDHC